MWKNIANAKSGLVQKTEYILLILSGLLALFTRFYKLTEIPYGLHVDEAGMAYDAWCLVHYSVDRWLNKYPVYLLNYGEGQSGLYAYLCALLIKVIGRGEVTVLFIRLPGAVISMLAYVAGVYIIWKTFQKHWSIIGAFLLAIMPYFIMQCRFGLDCNLLVNMLTISVCLLMRAEEKEKLHNYIIAGIAWGLTYYTYVLSYIPNTIILLCICSYLLWLDKNKWKKIIALLIPVIIFGIPLLFMIVINQFGMPQINLPFLTIPRLTVYRSGQIHFQWEKMIENVSEVLKSILWRDWLEYNAFSGYYTMYALSIPFVVIGFFSLYRLTMEQIEKKKFHPGQIWFLVFCVYFLFTLGISGIVVNRINGIFFAQFFCVLVGIRAIYESLKRRKAFVSYGFIGIILGLYIMNGSSFLHYYFEKYADEIYPQFLFCDTYEEILAHLEQEGKLQNTNIYTQDNYIYYCLSSKISPYEFNRPRHEEDYYNQFTFLLPDYYESGAVYIVRETNYEYIEMLEKYVSEQCRDGMYICYY